MWRALFTEVPRAGRGCSRRIAALAGVLCLASCDTPVTTVTFANGFPSGSDRTVVYRAFWHSVWWSQPLAPGESSGALPVVPASARPAWAVVGPTDGTDGGLPRAVVLLRSRAPVELRLNQQEVLTADGAAYDGFCDAGRPLSQAEADELTGLIFPADFDGLSYDAASCRLLRADGGAP